MTAGWRKQDGHLHMGDYGAGCRSFFVSSAACQAPALACQALTLESGFDILRKKAIEMLLRTVGSGLKALASSLMRESE